MIKLIEFENENLIVNWKTIELGLEGIGSIPSQITMDDILDFAVKSVQKNDYNQEILELAGLSTDNSEEIQKMVKKIVEKYEKNIDEQKEKRKLRLILLMKTMRNLNNNPLYGLIELTDFWQSVNDFGDKIPHTIQGVANEIAPEDYYTEKNFNSIINKHKDWIKNELKALR